jgi:hypothetical protein
VVSNPSKDCRKRRRKKGLDKSSVLCFIILFMDEKSQKLFDELVKNQPQDMTLGGLKFLFGRRSYMTSDQLAKFQVKFDEIQILNENKDKKVKKA